MVNQLIDIIGREASLFESFLKLLEEQKDALVKNDADLLNRVTERQREKIIESQLLNKQREKLVCEIKAANEIEGDLNVTRLLEIVDEEQAVHLKHLRETILELNERILTARNQNAMLLNKSREYIARMMSMLSKIEKPDNTYGNDGARKESFSQILVDRRV